MSTKKKKGESKADSKPVVLSADDAQLFADLMAQHETCIKNYIRTKVQEDLVEDLCQSVFLKALESFSTLHDKGKAVSWLYTITNRCIADHYADKWNELHVSLEDHETNKKINAASTPAAICEKTQEKERYQQARSRLKEPYRTLLKLHYEDELSYKEIAAKTKGSSPNTIRQQLTRGKKKLIKALNKELEPAEIDESVNPHKPRR